MVVSNAIFHGFYCPDKSNVSGITLAETLREVCVFVSVKCSVEKKVKPEGYKINIYTEGLEKTKQ